MNPNIPLESILFDDATSVTSGITQVLEQGSLGPATQVHETIDDGKKRRNWYIPGVFPTPDFEDKLTNAFEANLLELPFKTKWCRYKGEICPDTGRLHFNYCFSATQAITFNDLRAKIKGMGFENPYLSYFDLNDKKKLHHNLDYTGKDATAAPAPLGTVVDTGSIRGLTIPQWMHKYKETMEKNEGNTVEKEKQSSKEEARDVLKEYITALPEWEGIEELKAAAWTDKTLGDALSLYPGVAKEILNHRDAALRTVRRERKGIKILIGGAGSMKTTRAMNDGKPEGMPSEHFVYTYNYDEKYQNYSNQERVVLDEFRASCMRYDPFKMLTDNNNHGACFKAAKKYDGPVTFNHAEVWVVSNNDIPTWYSGIWKDSIALDAFLRRINNAEVVMRWKVSDINDPTSVIYDEDGSPVPNRIMGDDISVQYLDITDKLKACKSLYDLRELTVWYRDQLPHNHPLGLTDLDKTRLMGTCHYNDDNRWHDCIDANLPRKKPRTDNFGYMN